MSTTTASLENARQQVETTKKNGLTRPLASTLNLIYQIGDEQAQTIIDEVYGQEQIAAVVVEPQASLTEFERRALPLIERNVPVIPLLPGQKKAVLISWETKATTNRAQIALWGRQTPDANVASVAKAEPDGFWFFDADRAGLIDQIEKKTGHKIPDTFTVRSRPGSGHYYFRQNAASIAMGNRQASDQQGELWSARVDDRYVVGPLSIHPDTGKEYEVINDVPIVEAPRWLIDFCIQNDAKAEKTKTGHAELDSEEPIAQGSRNSALTSILGKARQVLAMDKDQLLAYGLSVNEKRCRPPLPEAEVKTIVGSVGSYAVKPTGKIEFPEQTSTPVQPELIVVPKLNQV